MEDLWQYFPLMASLSSVERRHLESVQIDPAYVTGYAGAGAQSVVRWYQEGAEGARRVVKMPLYQVWRDMYSQTMGRLLGQSYDSASYELDLCQRHFEPYTVPTEIRHDGDKNKFCIVQDAVEMQRLTPEICSAQPKYGDQLADIVQRNSRLMSKEGVWFDAQGWHAGRYAEFLLRGKPYLDNIVIDTKTDDLKLYDYGLFPLPQNARYFRWYYGMLLSSQQKNMRKYGHEFV